MEKILRPVAVAAILILLFYVVLVPQSVYAPVPRVILFFLAAVFLAVFLGAEASTRFELKLPGFLFVTGGAAALALGTMWVLYLLSKPDRQIVVAEVVDERGQSVNLNVAGALELIKDSSGLVAGQCISGNSIFLVFPEQFVEQQIRVRTVPGEAPYVGKITYAKPPSQPLTLGKDLVKK